MSDWDAIFGEAALGLDLAKADPVPGGSGPAPARRSQQPPVQAQPGPRPGRPAGQATASPAAAPPAGRDARPSQAAGPSLKLVSRLPAPATNPEAIFRREALGSVSAAATPRAGWSASAPGGSTGLTG